MAARPLYSTKRASLVGTLSLALLARRPTLVLLGVMPFSGIVRRPLLPLATAVGLFSRAASRQPGALLRPRFCAARSPRRQVARPDHIAV